MTRCFGAVYSNRITTFVFAFVLALALAGCTRLERSPIGGDLLPGGDRLITDTMLLPVTTTSFIENDTAALGKGEQHILGYINDPMFGTTTAAVYLQTLPLSYPFRFPATKDSLLLDSAVLSLAYRGLYGDTGATTRINVYRITDPGFVAKKMYRLTEGANFSPANLLGTQTFTPRQVRTGYKLAFRNDSVFNQIRIRLSDPFARSLLDQDNQTGALRNDTAFKQFLNGFAIVVDSTFSGSALHYISLADIETRLNLYYRVIKPGGSFDTTASVFPFVPDTIRSANANKVHRNYAGSVAAPHLSSGLPSSLAFVQAAPGTSVNIRVPALDTLVGKSYIIHRAELVARQIFTGPAVIENQFRPPNTHLFTIAPNGANAAIPFDSLNYFVPGPFDFFRQAFLYNLVVNYTGGIPSFRLDGSNNPVAEYYLNITRYVQNIITGRANRRDFRLSAPYIAAFRGPILGSASINALANGRVQLGGGTHPQHPMFVRIYYSKQ